MKMILLRVAILLLPVLASPAAGQPVGTVKDFYGVIPGETTRYQLEANDRWGKPVATRYVAGFTHWIYYIAPWKEVIAVLQNGRVKAIELVPPEEFDELAGLAADLKLNPLQPLARVPNDAKTGIALPPATQALQASHKNALALVHADGTTQHVTRVRLYPPSRTAAGAEANSNRQANQRADAGGPTQVVEFHGVVPGATTVSHLSQLTAFGPVLESNQSSGGSTEFRTYRFGSWQKVILSIEDDIVWTVDLVPSAELVPEEAARLLGLGDLAIDRDSRPGLVDSGMEDPTTRDPFGDLRGAEKAETVSGERRRMLRQQHAGGPATDNAARPDEVWRRVAPPDPAATSVTRCKTVFAVLFVARSANRSTVRRIRLYADVPMRSSLLGIEVRPLPRLQAVSLGLKPTGGVLVDRILPGSPAARAALSAGDVVVAVDGGRFSGDTEFLELTAKLSPGVEHQLTVRRASELVEIRCRPAPTPLATNFAHRALHTSRMAQAMYKSSVAERDEKGALVAELYIHISTEMWWKAMADCDQALQLQPNNMLALIARARCWQALRQPKRAIADYTRVLTGDPQSQTALGGRAATYQAIGSFTAALADYDRIVSVLPDDASLRVSRGIVHAQLKQHGPALEDFTRAIQIDPQLGVAYHNRGILYQRMGQTDRAQADLDKAKQLEARNSRDAGKARGVPSGAAANGPRPAGGPTMRDVQAALREGKTQRAAELFWQRRPARYGDGPRAYSVQAFGMHVSDWSDVEAELSDLVRQFDPFAIERFFRGVRVRSVEASGPAARAGLKQGERIVEVAQQAVKSAREFNDLCAAHFKEVHEVYKLPNAAIRLKVEDLDGKERLVILNDR